MKKAAVLLLVSLVTLFAFSITTTSNTPNALAQSTAEPIGDATMEAIPDPDVHVDPVLGGAATETWSYTYVAQQDFEKGFMFWLSSTKEIWVLINTGGDSGEWRSYQDTFVDGDPETDMTLTAPTEKLYQPRRGFGKLWRDPATGLRDALGWGTTPEFAITTPISYLKGSSNAPGRYLFLTMSRQVFSLHEATPGKSGGTWRLVGTLFEGNFWSPPQLPSTAEPTSEATMEATP